MSKVHYSSNSPYHNTKQTSWYLDLWEPIDINSNPSDKIITLGSKYHNRPDLLAYDLYGNPTLWWVFMSRNPEILDPIYDFNSGLKIYVPTLNQLMITLGG